MKKNIFVGIDSCRAGWFVVSINKKDQWACAVFENISQIWQKYRQAKIILIDIPIGLPINKDRACDVLARKILKGRSSSVFAPPIREALYADNYRESCEINQQLLGKKISIQAWNICPKIREVDQFLTSIKNSDKSKIHESFPELCFWALSGGHVMQHRKKLDQGYGERLKVLSSIFDQSITLINYALTKYKRKDVAKDDILDALILALTARTGIDQLYSIPKSSQRDIANLPMEMVISKKYLEADVLKELQNL